MSKSEIQKVVELKYCQVAANPDREFNFPVGKAFTINVGYPKKVSDNLPESILKMKT